MYKRCVFIVWAAIAISFGGVCNAGIVHRYSFDGNVNDVVGSAHGVLVNNTGSAAFADGLLTLGNDGTQGSNQDPLTGDYVDLPNGIISAVGNAVTFEFWVIWNGPANTVWQEIVYFGMNAAGVEGASSGAGQYLAVIPRSGSEGNTLRVTCRNAATGSESYVNWTSALTVGQEHHIVIAWDGAGGQFSVYVDGQYIGSKPATIDLSILDDRNNWLGRSGYPDLLFVGSYNEFRIYDSVLSADNALANYQAGPDVLVEHLEPPADPDPADSAQNIWPVVTLKWDSVNTGIINHIVYLDDDAEAVKAATVESVGIYRATLPAETESYSIADLEIDKTYYWRIDEVAADSTVVRGNLWQFHTANLLASARAPFDDAVGVGVYSQWRWSEGFNASGHDVYWGLSLDSLQLRSQNQGDASYNPPVLQYAQRYYWRIDERFPDGLVQTGDVWTFTTSAKPPACTLGDLTGDCLVNMDDIAALVGQWLTIGGCQGYDCGDVNGDGVTDLADYAIIQEKWLDSQTPWVVINEIHYNPDKNTQPHEFIELYNAGAAVVDLTGWRFSDGSEYVFRAAAVIEPGE